MIQHRPWLPRNRQHCPPPIAPDPWLAEWSCCHMTTRPPPPPLPFPLYPRHRRVGPHDVTNQGLAGPFWKRSSKRSRTYTPRSSASGRGPFLPAGAGGRRRDPPRPPEVSSLALRARSVELTMGRSATKPGALDACRAKFRDLASGEAIETEWDGPLLPNISSRRSQPLPAPPSAAIDGSALWSARGSPEGFSRLREGKNVHHLARGQRNR